MSCSEISQNCLYERRFEWFYRQNLLWVVRCPGSSARGSPDVSWGLLR